MARKYTKLLGHEVAAPDNEKRAKAFMRWFSLRFDRLRTEWLYAGKFDDEVATDTAMYIYDSIALKGTKIIGKYKSYYLRAYHNRLKAVRMKQARLAAATVWLDDPEVNLDLAAPTFDYEHFEALVDAVNNEMMEYVRERYPPLDASLFEIYIALQPNMSYKRMGKMLGYSPNKIWPVIGAIRRDLALKFVARRDYLLSLVE